MTAAIVGAWLGLALVVTMVMARRGHDAFQWGLLGVVLGPVAIPLAIAHRQKVARAHGPAVEPLPADGRVLVGVRPGTTVADVAPALRGLTELAGPVGMTLAAVIDAEACERPTGPETVAAAERFLDEVATSLTDAGVAAPPIHRRVLFGDPASALSSFATECGATLVVVGAGEPLARRAMHGSTRSRLLRHATVPVLCVPGHAPRRRTRALAGRGRA